MTRTREALLATTEAESAALPLKARVANLEKHLYFLERRWFQFEGQYHNDREDVGSLIRRIRRLETGERDVLEQLNPSQHYYEGE